ncbi:MAG: excinuclease ABC subunit UvrC [Bdellovibrionales bacterium]|nr:excinuclease ABC subunit UvrC [Bdellovibrionales bacterium]
MEEKLKVLKKNVRHFPSLPGVYLMKNKENQILYVGKAKSLKLRVLSYFNANSSQLKIDFLLKKTDSIEYLLTDNEVEAFLLESSLIKKHKPLYNVRLKDDKSYPYIRFTKDENFPRFYFERRVKDSKHLYFGPYTEGFTVRAILDFLNQNFHLRDCSNSDFKTRKRPCLNFDIGICPAPCVGKISPENYRKNYQKALNFLRGQSKGLVKKLQTEMKQAVKVLNFELAARNRDCLQAIERIEMNQVVVQKTDKDKDVVVLQSLEGKHLIEILHFRKGRLIGNRFQLIKNSEEDFLMSFLNQYYLENLIPDELVIPLPIKKGRKILEKVLTQRKKTMCRIVSNLSAENKILVRRAEMNAFNHLKDEIQKSKSIQEHLKEIQLKFHLPYYPHRIECYDISHWQGSYSVGSGVVFEEGKPLKKDYRLYNLKTVQEGDDFLALQEVFSRRLSHREYKKPDLVLIDGGRGQLKAIQNVLHSKGVKDWSVVSLAKDRFKTDSQYLSQKSTGERFFLPGRKNPLIFPSHSKALKILLHLRDEAHRFAILSHRKKRDKMFLKGDLDLVKGLSSRIKEKLLKSCGSMENIRSMSEIELANLDFISKALSRRIKEVMK